MDKKLIFEKVKNNASIGLEEFDKELNKQQRDTNYCIQNKSILMEEQEIKELSQYKVCKIYSCYIKNIVLQELQLDMKNSSDQRSLEGCVFENCTFTEWSGAASMNECLFIGCSFSDCDFRNASFVNCIFENTSAENTDFTMANFSLSNYRNIIVNDCKTEGSLLLEIAEEKEEAHIDNEMIKKYKEISFDLMENAMRLFSASLFLNEDMSRFDVTMADISKFVKEERRKFEEEGISNLDFGEIRKRLDVHEAWSNQILRKEYDKPDIDWTKINYSGYSFKNCNLSGIDFSGSNMSSCDFSGANLTGVNFTNCNLTACSLWDAIFAQNDFTGAKLEKITIDKGNEKLFMNAGIPMNTNQTGLNQGKE